MIEDSSPPPLVTISSPSSGPLAENGGTAVITAVLSAPSGFPTTLTLSFTGSAQLGTNFSISGAGYNPATQSFVIPAGSTSVSLIVTSIDDQIYGPPQISSTIAIASATNANPAGNPATIVFNQGDPPGPTIKT